MLWLWLLRVKIHPCRWCLYDHYIDCDHFGSFGGSVCLWRQDTGTIQAHALCDRHCDFHSLAAGHNGHIPTAIEANLIPDGPHTDWFWPFSKIPRKWTAIPSNKEPKQIFGDVPVGDHLDVPPKGTWTLAWPPHLAWTSKSGSINRISLARYDYNGHYYQIGSLRLGSLTALFKRGKDANS